MSSQAEVHMMRPDQVKVDGHYADEATTGHVFVSLADGDVMVTLSGSPGGLVDLLGRVRDEVWAQMIAREAAQVRYAAERAAHPLVAVSS